VGSALLETIESEAKKKASHSLYAEASVTAYPFFLAMGFVITKEVNNIVCDAPARQYYMRKELS
jgi:N-acetylglutamate synthase-like GNAT family acetyltransferase